MHRTPFQTTVGVIALFLPLGSFLVLTLRDLGIRDYSKSAFVIIAALTIVCFFVTFDRRVSKFEFLPMLNASWKTWWMTGVTFGIWTFVIGSWLREPLTMIAAPFMTVFALGVSLPVTGICVVVRKHIRPLDEDNFIRCRVCEYRVDNLTGARCPECGTPIDGSFEVQS